MQRAATVATIAASLLLAVPTAALAHPALNPSSIPAGRTIDAMLVVPHGCAPGGGMPDMEEQGAEADPTVELALQQQTGVTLAPAQVDGWTVTDDGEAWVWRDAGGATTDVIEFPVTVTLADDLDDGTRLYLKAFQACDGGSSFQWIGTPEEEAEWPAVLLEVSDGEIGDAEADDGMQMDHGDMADDDMAMDADAAGDDTAMDEDTADEMTAEPVPETIAADPGDEGLPVGLVVAIGIVLAAAAGGVAIRSRRG
jgi:uncharacterized protein YcnI